MLIDRSLFDDLVMALSAPKVKHRDAYINWMSNTEKELVSCKLLKWDLSERKVGVDHLYLFISEAFSVKTTQIERESHNAIDIPI